MPSTVDLNADLGEGFGAWTLGDDEGLLDVVTSANVACGFHAGDPTIMRRVCGSAVARGVVIGAQVGYRDLAGFGRRFLDVAPAELSDEVTYQIGALDAFARVAGDRVRYVKAHGALYHTALDDAGQAGAIVSAVRAYPEELALVTLAGGELARQAEAVGLMVVAEAFADRAYTAEGRLVSRRLPGALLHDPAQIAARAVHLVAAGTVQTVCVHGDTPGALDIARAVRAALSAASVTLTPFARP